MNAPSSLPDLAPITRRRKPDRGARGRAAPKRVLTTVELQSFDPDACEMVTQTAQAYTRALPPAMAALPEPLRKAALAYAKAVEDVEAGGASDPAVTAASGAGGATHEGRHTMLFGRLSICAVLRRQSGRALCIWVAGGVRPPGLWYRTRPFSGLCLLMVCRLKG